MSDQQRRKSDARESGTVQRVRNSARALPLNLPHVLLACSAGKDSVALAFVLGELHRLGAITLSIAHIHHGQHDSADAAAEAVIDIGNDLGVPVIAHRLSQQDINAHIGIGLEEALRRERYLALGRIATDTGADCLAIAHHQTDQAETILLHLLRGCGADGLTGMREWELRKIPWWKSKVSPVETGIWRPFLHERAEDIAEIARTSGFPIVEDPTNTDTGFRRNAIRHILLPVIEEISPGATGAVARSGDLLAMDADYLNSLANEALADTLEDGSLVRKRLLDLPEAIQYRVIRSWILQDHPELELSLERVRSVRLIAINNRGGSTVELGSDVAVRLHNGRLELNPWQNTDN